VSESPQQYGLALSRLRWFSWRLQFVKVEQSGGSPTGSTVLLDDAVVYVVVVLAASIV
jgi:hypothetical protein